MKKIDLAYIAGIIDGEGSIVITHHKNVNSPWGGSFRLEVTVSNTCEWLIQWLYFSFGGIKCKLHRPKYPDKNYHQWRITDQVASKFLSLILPYLHFKKPQAELGIKYQHRRHIGERRTNDRQALEEADKILMSKMNHR